MGFDPRAFHEKHHQSVRHAVKAGLWTLLALAGVEMFLRIALYSPGITYVVDPDLGKTPTAGNVVVWGVEGHGVTHYVATGEIATPYTGGRNVVVLGDSHTEAFQVDDGRNYVSVAERLLREHGLEMDLHNLGFSGATLADFVSMAPVVRRRYAPELVVVQIGQSDFGSEGFDTTRMNHFVLHGDSLQLVRTPPVDSAPAQGRWLRRRLALVNYGYFRYDKIHAKIAAGHAAGGDAARVARMPDTTLLQLQALRDAYAGLRVMVLVLPDVPKISEHQIVSDDAEYAALVETVRGVSTWAVVDPLSGFRSLAAQRRLPRGFANTLPGDGHLNADGHAVIGARLAAQIESLAR